jgi:hypothetical protein
MLLFIILGFLEFMEKMLDFFLLGILGNWDILDRIYL